jgi:deoxyribodipyrimidine photo-lyase
MDAIARELIATGYLHNHARMWWASYWIHVERLPWELGADWFLRHLLDADPASNTLSWRWVAGNDRAQPAPNRAVASCGRSAS